MTQSLETFLPSGENAAFVEMLYDAYLEDPQSVPSMWQDYFHRLGEQELGADKAHSAVKEAYTQTQALPVKPPTEAQPESADTARRKQVAVLQLINAYRFRGHRQADLDPLKQYERPDVAELDPTYHGLSEDDMDTVFNTGSLYGPAEASLRDILDTVRTTYCGCIGAEYMHINETAQKRWVQQRLELHRATPKLSAKEKQETLYNVVAASKLEEYLHTKYVGQKRFSLEGGESLIPLLDNLVQRSGENKVREVVIGMAHRGRLNVLVNIVGKLPTELFDEFAGKRNTGNSGSGDVKYHLGYSSDIVTPDGPMHVTLAFNPSHLEIINPVVEGSVRARQDRRGDITRNQVLPIIVHGDAAFAGQGVVMETLNLSQTRGYGTGGTVHVVVNNQIGFTTSDPLDSRSTLYCTDVAKMIQAPILHVNADHPEAVLLVTEMALDYRMEFNKDIVIDLICYRRQGHSETDEPAATQPIMYRRIKQHPSVRKLYTDQLIQDGTLSADTAREIEDNYVRALEENQVVSRPVVCQVNKEFHIDFTPFHGTKWRAPAPTHITLECLQRLAEQVTTVPQDFPLHNSVKRIIEARRKMGRGEQAIDWGFAETLAYASLLEDGHPVRVSGQDSERGTFFHRHAVLHNNETAETYVPLQSLTENPADFTVINSTLSEEAVLAFEYGYASSEPNSLVIWEAQFGDFANGAQVVIDQFISSCESKWGRYCGLVMLLPHGYDGQGPEHSSARLERYLQLCAEENMQVCYPSTPAQNFHLLRRQVLRPYRKPLVVMSPKSLLRHKLATSSVEEMTEGAFQTVIDEVDAIEPEAVSRVVVCSGKVYYDLLEARRANDIEDIAIIRLEQLYPFPKQEVEATLSRYAHVNDVVWVQEEPRNQGSWVYLMARLHLFGCLKEGQMLLLVARPYSASPAVGSLSKHLEQQKALITDALQLNREEELNELKRA